MCIGWAKLSDQVVGTWMMIDDRRPRDRAEVMTGVIFVEETGRRWWRASQRQGGGDDRRPRDRVEVMTGVPETGWGRTHHPVICGPVPYTLTTTQCSVVQCLTPWPRPSVLLSSALHLDHDPVFCCPVPYTLTTTQCSVVQCLTPSPRPSVLLSSTLHLDHDTNWCPSCRPPLQGKSEKIKKYSYMEYCLKISGKANKTTECVKILISYWTSIHQLSTNSRILSLNVIIYEHLWPPYLMFCCIFHAKNYQGQREFDKQFRLGPCGTLSWDG